MQAPCLLSSELRSSTCVLDVQNSSSQSQTLVDYDDDDAMNYASQLVCVRIMYILKHTQKDLYP